MPKIKCIKTENKNFVEIFELRAILANGKPETENKNVTRVVTRVNQFASWNLGSVHFQVLS